MGIWMCLFPFLLSLLLHSMANDVGECDALLQFSNSFTLSQYAPEDYYDYESSVTSYPKTASWKNGTDCCSWDGVTCDATTNQVTGLELSYSWLLGPFHSSSTLFSLPYLRRLNLAGNNFNGSRISPMFGIFTGMTHLNLSTSHFSGPIPLEIISHLSNLTTLDLSGNYDLIGDRSFGWLIHNLTQLSELVLDGVNMSRISPISLTNLSSSLTSLSLSFCDLQGVFPIDIFHFPNLRSLSLCHNFNLTGTLPQSNWTCPLVSLDLSFTNFHGAIPGLLGNLTSVNSLDFSSSRFAGAVPPTLEKLEHLTHLDLGYNNLSGPVDFAMFARLKNLKYLSLGGNNLTVVLQSDGNCSFPGLQFLDLYHCNLTKFPYFLRFSAQLGGLVLSENMISGRIPKWFWRVGSDTLIHLYLSSNQFIGEIPSLICQMSLLSRLYLSNNRFRGTFPRCLGNSSTLSKLYLNDNLLHGVIEVPLPPRLSCLKLSNNNFSGQLPMNFLLNSSIDFIDITNNSFDGALPIPPPTITYYSLSNNKFRGGIPYHICNATGLNIINLSNNRLTGTIPHCFINFSASLEVLDLRANRFFGKIPEIFVQKANNLQTIRLSQNQLGGTLPQSLALCKNLEVLDLSENELEDSFPYWLDNLPNLQVLALRSNKFHGPVDSSSRTDHPFPKLRIFDLSKNNFLGPLPAKYLANLIAMKNEGKGGLQYMGGSPYYINSIMVEMKGMRYELVKILTMLTTIDFSNNFFEGKIPKIIGDLKALKGLNFSRNNLSGNIPSSLGNLTNLEWLDLSSNKLNGKIPRELAGLTSICFLNLSNNQLTGPIPQSTQFNTFDHSFDGNLGLCGRPLTKECENDARQTHPSISHEEEEMKSGNSVEWRAVLIAYGCGLVFGISAGYIMLETGRPRWLVRMVEQKIHSRITNEPMTMLFREIIAGGAPEVRVDKA